MRLFYALELPVEMRNKLWPFAASVTAAFPASRPVRAANLHITLHFVGECDPSGADAFCHVLCEAYRRSQEQRTPVFPLNLVISGLGFFRSGSGRVLWLSVEPRREIERFHAILLDAMRSRGIRTERSGPLVPHITIARNVSGLERENSVGEIPGQAGIAELPGFEVTVPSLMESVTAGGRTEYRVFCRPGQEDGFRA